MPLSPAAAAVVAQDIAATLNTPDAVPEWTQIVQKIYASILANAILVPALTCPSGAVAGTVVIT